MNYQENSCLQILIFFESLLLHALSILDHTTVHMNNNSTNKNVNFFHTEKDQGSIEIYEPSGAYKIEISSSRPAAVWRVTIKGHPKPTVVWYDNSGREITKLASTEKADKYETNTTGDQTILKIRFLELKDSGFYTLKAYNGLVTTEKKFELVVKGSENSYFFNKKKLNFICVFFQNVRR